MRLLLFGADGQVGWELRRSLAPLGELVALNRRGREGVVGDLADQRGIEETIRTVRPEVIVNAAAYTAVDRAETEREKARELNALAPGRLAEATREAGALLVHFSTDYVFDGSGEQAWNEDSPTGPLNVYGATKLEGEERIRESGCRYLMFRTSWVYSCRGTNFVRTILRLAREREELSVVDDQVGAPSGAELLADVCAHAVRACTADRRLEGVYHVTAHGETSWWGLARLILERAAKRGLALRATAQSVRAISTEAFGAPAARPLNSRLAVEKLERTFGLRMPEWEDGVRRVVDELAEAAP